MTIPDAIVTAVGAAVLDVAVFDGIVPTEPPNRYAVVYPDTGTLAALAVCGISDSVTVRWQVTSVAPDREMAAWIAITIRDTTVDTKPAVDGWVVGPIRHTFSQTPQRDEAVLDRPVVYQVDLYGLLATRA